MASDFSNLNAFISLKNMTTKSMIALEKSYMLDDVEVN